MVTPDTTTSTHDIEYLAHPTPRSSRWPEEGMGISPHGYFPPQKNAILYE